MNLNAFYAQQIAQNVQKIHIANMGQVVNFAQKKHPQRTEKQGQRVLRNANYVILGSDFQIMDFLLVNVLLAQVIIKVLVSAHVFHVHKTKCPRQVPLNVLAQNNLKNKY